MENEKKEDKRGWNGKVIKDSLTPTNDRAPLVWISIGVLFQESRLKEDEDEHGHQHCLACVHLSEISLADCLCSQHTRLLAFDP